MSELERLEVDRRAQPSMAELREAAEASVVAAQPTALVPREVPIRISDWRDPETGTLRSCSVVSKVMDGTAKRIMSTMVADQAAGRAWDSFPPAMQARMWALARCYAQIVEFKDAGWICAAIDGDDDLLFGLEERLQAHERMFRHGVDSSGKLHPPAFRLVAPAIDAARPGADNGAGA